MARRRVVSRTIKTTEVMVKVYDPSADSVSDVSVTLTGVTEGCSITTLEKKCKEALDKQYVGGVRLVVLKATVVNEETRKYIMDEELFVTYAEVKDSADDSADDTEESEEEE